MNTASNLQELHMLPRSLFFYWLGTQAQDAFVKLMTSGVSAATAASAPREKP